MERMNPLDATFLHVEDGVTHLQIASCAVFEGPQPPYEQLVEMFAAKLPLVPRYRQRVRFVPFDLGRPVWIDDPDFNLEYHMRRTAVPAPGGEKELCALMARVMSKELDRERPLWETWIVEGLSGGRWAMLSLVHHCMVDGVSGTDMMGVVLDHTREPAVDPALPLKDPWVPEPAPTDLQLVTDALAQRFRSPYEMWRSARSALRTPRRAMSKLGEVGLGVMAMGGNIIHPTPPTSLDGGIGPARRWAVARATIDDIRVVRKELGGTLNDVVLAAVTNGFRELILHRGEDPEAVVLRSLIPVSVRAPSARGAYDNRVSSIYLELPTHVAEPVARLSAVRARMDALKASHETEAGEAIVALATYGSGAIQGPMMRTASRLLHRFPQRSVNTVVTNVPGPPQPLYAAGREMLEYLPFVPLSHGVRLGVAVLSYNGRMFFGVTGDFDTAPDVGVLAKGIERGMRDLVKAARKQAGKEPVAAAAS
ncbi:MAG TPA: wax ester/triacylglycerol synthase family O-acyltransferase [Acidimicrobiales bacterium]